MIKCTEDFLMLADKWTHRTHNARLIHAVFALGLTFFSLPSLAVIVLHLDLPDSYRFATPTSTMSTIVVSVPFPTGSTSPTLSRNLQRAHAWSNNDGQNSNYGIIQPRQTSLQSNMARAQAFRNN